MASDRQYLIDGQNYGIQGNTGQPYPPHGQGQPYPGQGQPYPGQGQPYPGQGQPFPSQGQPYPGQGQPYPPAGAAPGYPGQGQQYTPPGGYPPQGGAPYPPPAGAVPGAPPGSAPSGYPPQGATNLAIGGDVDAPTFTGEKAAEDVHDNPSAQAPVPSAPPIEKMEHIAGYDNTSFNTAALAPPPSYEDVMNQPPPANRQTVSNVPTITEEQAREALIQFVSEHCCYGKGAAQKLEYRDLKSSSAFHYTLESFAEGRSTAWAYEPYAGQPLDGPQFGAPPPPWDIAVKPPAMFANGKAEVEVPHTASIKPCHDCMGMGRTRCYRCMGRGRVICSFCHGSGRRHVTNHHHHGHHDDHHHGHHHHHEDNRCTFCHGMGRKRCSTCHGHGQITCATCQGRMQLKCYIKLTVTWTNHTDDHIVERTSLPDELIRGVSGETAFQEENPRVWPINHFPDSVINDASRRLVAQHNTAFPTERILSQRQKVRIVPVTEAVYEFKGKEDIYFVYGFEHKVHAPNYPETCCCGCTIL